MRRLSKPCAVDHNLFRGPLCIFSPLVRFPPLCFCFSFALMLSPRVTLGLYLSAALSSTTQLSGRRFGDVARLRIGKALQPLPPFAGAGFLLPRAFAFVSILDIARHTTTWTRLFQSHSMVDSHRACGGRCARGGSGRTVVDSLERCEGGGRGTASKLNRGLDRCVRLPVGPGRRQTTTSHAL